MNVRPDGMRAVFLQDPNGYWIEINDFAAEPEMKKAPAGAAAFDSSTEIVALGRCVGP